MRAFRPRLQTLVALVVGVALACGWLVAWSRWRPRPPRPAERIVGAILEGRANRPVRVLPQGPDFALPVLGIVAAVAASRAGRGLTGRRGGPAPRAAGSRR
jgi:hypothetical protein